MPARSPAVTASPNLSPAVTGTLEGTAPASNRRQRRDAARQAARQAQAGRRLRRLGAWLRWLRWPRISRLLGQLMRRWLAAVFGAATLAFAAGPVYAQITAGTLPAGGVVVTGSGQLQASPNLLTIRQSSDRLGIDWQSFSIGRDATVEFLQPGPGSIALNRVVGHESSQIYGRLRANGQVFLTNPNGVLFAPGARVDVGGLVASTLDIAQADFADGRFVLQAVAGQDGSVVNEGELSARAGGYLAFFGQRVDNRGELRVDTGSVVLASGRAATVSISGSGLISAVVTPGSAGEVLNSGAILADGGSVRMTAASAEAMAQSLVNNSGIVRANSIEERAGQIWITGDQVQSSGRIQADAQGGGDAGQVTIKADMKAGSLELGGEISARADQGLGGQVETSAARVAIADDTRVATLAGSGRHGTWLIDPTNFTVSAGSGASTSSGIGASTLSANLEGGNVELMTAPEGDEAGDIFVNAAVSWNANTLLTLTAARNVEINADVTATGDAAGLAVNPGGAGTFTMAMGAQVRLPGVNSTFSLGGTGYTMIRSLAELQAIDGSSTALAGNYALADDLDASASATEGFSPIGNESLISVAVGNAFRGRFQGLGNAIEGLVINLPSSSSTGLFANIDNAQIENLRIEGGSVLGSQNVGALAGTYDGTTLVDNVHSSMAVSAYDDANTGVAVGGLLGNNVSGSTIRRSSASGAVTGNTPDNIAYVGGLIGRMAGGTVSDSSASGNVTATLREGSTSDSAFYVGGLIGVASSAISGASAGGDVSGGRETGGLVGRYTPNSASLTDSSATGTVSGGSAAGGLVGTFTATGGALITGSQASGDVSGAGTVGGLVGVATGTGGIANSSGRGDVSTTASASVSLYSGGVVGHYFLSLAPSALAGHGQVSGGNSAGGVIGYLQTAAAALPAGSLVSVVPEGTTKTVTGPRWVGGLVGYSASTGLADGLSFSGVVTATEGSGETGAVGGLFGRSNGPVTNSSTSGIVSGANIAGGLVGMAQGSGGFDEVDSTATVTGTGAAGYVGGLVGYFNHGSSLTNATASGNVSGGNVTGGLVGYANSNVVGAGISDSSATGNVSVGGTSSQAGGLVGQYAMRGRMERVSAAGTVSGSGLYAGGLVGLYNSTGALDTAFQTGATVSGTRYVGGLIGYGGAFAMSNVSAVADVSGGGVSSPEVGGLAGRTGGAISNATATGNVSVSNETGNLSAGGLVGSAEGGAAANISDVSASGNVTVVSTTGSTSVGGLIGYAPAGNISNAEASGAVSGGIYTGGLIGYYTSSTGVISGGSATGAVSGLRDAGGLVGYATGGGSITGSTASGNVQSAAASSNSVGGAIGYTGLSGGVNNVSATGTVSGGLYTGGVIGFHENGSLSGLSTTITEIGGTGWVGGFVGYSRNSTVSGLSSAVNVTHAGTSGGAGGVFGFLSGSISGSGATGTVAATAESGTVLVGGLAGEVDVGAVTGSTASGAVSGGSETGGLVGRYNPTGGSLMSGSSASGNVIGRSVVGGLVGEATGTGGISNAFATGTVESTGSESGANYTGGAVGRYGLTLSPEALSASGNVTGGQMTGGVIGYISTAGVALAEGSVVSVVPADTTKLVTGPRWVGGLVGYSAATGTASDLSFAGTVTATGVSGGAGGLFGYSGGAVIDSTSSGTVSGGGYAGGLVGQAGGSGGFADVSSSATVTGGTYVGGLVGDYFNSGAMERVTASGNVSGGSRTGGLVGNHNSTGAIDTASYTGTAVEAGVFTSGTVYLGGLFGYSRAASITGATATLDLSNASTGTLVIGGLAGRTGGAVTDSSATGDVSATGETGQVYAGGLIGQAEGSGALTGVSASGDVTVAATTASSGRTGGLVGEASSGDITDAEASGNVVGQLYVGGLVGLYNSSSGSISASSASGDVISMGDAGGLVGYASGSGGIGSSSASGNVLSSATSTYSVGGAVGYTTQTGGVNGVSASGTVSGGTQTGGVVGYANNSSAPLSGLVATGGSVSGHVWAGGLVGYSSSTVAVSGLSYTGNVSATDSFGGAAGGLFGRSAGAISDSSSAGTVTANHDAGGLVGVAQGSGGFTDVSSTATVSNPTGNGNVGGLVGYYNHGGTLLRGTATGTVSGGSNVGGLVGWANSGVTGAGIEASSASGDVTATGGTYVGGLVGRYTMAGAMSGVTASGDVRGNNNSTGGLVGYFNSSAALTTASHTGETVSEGVYVGGLIGYSESASISGVSAVATVLSERDGTIYVGGLIGFAAGSGTLTDATASGSVTSTATSGSGGVGGLVGYSQLSSISDAAASGNVSGGLHTGGLVGNSSPGSGIAGDITSSEASGTVSGRGNVGGLVGYATGTGSVSNSTASGDVSSSDTGSYNAGGAVGYSAQAGGVTDVAVSGTVSGGAVAGAIVGQLANSSAVFTGNSTTATTVSGYTWVGGLVGYSNTSLSGLTAAITVTHLGSSGAAGGLVGYINGALTDSSASGNVTGGASVGGLAGQATGTGAKSGLTATGNVSSTSTGTVSVGGLIGEHNGGALSASSATGSVSGGYYVGGLLGSSAASAAIDDVQASGNVSATRNGAHVGGLIGSASSSGALTQASAEGDVSAAGTSSYVGGLVGLFQKSGGIDTATATGAVSGGSYTGGLVGYFGGGGPLANASATGAVSGQNYAGGLVGEMYYGGNAINLRADGAVTSNGEAGGLIGRWQYSGTLTDSLATGAVLSAGTAGGLVGFAYDNNGVSNSRASGDVRGTGSVGGLFGVAGYTSISFGQASGNVTGISTSGGFVYAGGLAGQYYQYDTDGGILDSNASGSVTVDGGGSYTGGLVGIHSAGRIERSGASGAVTAQDSGNASSSSHRAGGLVGRYSGNGTDVFADNSASGNVTAAGNAGGLVAEFNGSTSGNIPTNVSATGQVVGRGNVGGLIGELNYVGLLNATATGSVTNLSSGGSTGGLVGNAQAYYNNATITDSRASGSVTGGYYAGGLVGYYFSYYYFSTGTRGIIASEASGAVSGSAIAGGLAGSYLDYYGSVSTDDVDLGIRDSRATGSVQGRYLVGGLVGQFYGSSGIHGSLASGNVELQDSGSFGNTAAGGLVGEFQSVTYEEDTARIVQSTASGSVTQTAVSTGGCTGCYSQAAGGLVGRLLGNDAATVVLQDAYATGDVTVATLGSTVNAGGLVGSTNASLERTYATGAVSTSGTASTIRTGGLVAHTERTGTTATASYWASDTTGQATSVLGTASTLEAMRSSATFEGWDIAVTGGSDSVWRQYEGRSLPLLRNFLAPLTIVLTDVDRVYDGTTGLGIEPILIGDVLVNNPSAITVFGDAVNVGAYTITGDNITSSQGGYDLVLDGSATLTITPRPLTLTGVVLDKVYDGTTTATLASSPALGNLVPGEDLLFTPGSDFAAAFETRTAGVNKPVVLAGSYAITDGTVGRASNYILPSGSATTATITPKPLTVGAITAVDRVYDGTTVVAVNAAEGTLSGVIDGDAVAFDPASVTSGTIPDRNVGTRPVAVTGATLTGADAGNYSIAGLDGITVQITPKELTLNGLVAPSRGYNADTYVSINSSGASLSGVVDGDLVLPQTGSLYGVMADRHVGDGKPLTIVNAAIRGPDAGNYTVVANTVTVNITPYLLTVGLQHTGSSSREYDGTTNASVVIPSWYWYGVDDISVTPETVGFADKNVAYDGSGNVVGKTITATGITITGPDAGNYALQNTTATIGGTITPRQLTVSGVSAVDRVYDGTRDVQVDIASAVVDVDRLIDGDEVNVSTPSGTGTVTGQVEDRNVGTNKPVTVPGLALTGADALNYTITGSGSGVTVDITAKEVTATYFGQDKVYDGNGNAVVTATLAGVIDGDNVNQYVNLFCTWVGSGCAYFVNEGGTPGSFTQNRNAGTDKPVVVTYNDLRGEDAGNYRLVNPTGSAAPADVTPKPVTLVFSGGTRVYDGGTDATATLNTGASGIFSVDAITSTQAAVFTGDGARNVGSAKPISVTDIVASGTGIANYTILNTTATTTGTITPKPVVVSGITATSRAYDGTTTVAVAATDSIGSEGFIDGDAVSITLPAEGLSTGTIATPGVGTAKPVTVTGLGLEGADAANYSIDLSGSGISVDITPKALVPAFTVLDKTYDGGISASVVSVTDGIVEGDVLGFTQLALFTGAGAKNVGSDKPVAITDIRLTGASAANYSLASTTASATGDIVPKPVTASYVGASRVYNGLDDLSAPVVGSSLAFVTGDSVGLSQVAVLTGDGSAGTDKPVSISDILITGADAGNYTLTSTTASTTATITPRPLAVTGVTAVSRVYDGTLEVQVNVSGATVDTSNVVPGDTVSVELPPEGISTGLMGNRFVGVNKPVTISGAALGGASSANYVLVGATGLTVTITPRPLEAAYTALDKVYDGTANATVVATPVDLLAVDAGGVGVSASGVFSAGRNAGDDKTVAVSGGFLTGAFAANYTLANTSGSATADITQRLLSVSYGAISRVYDGGVSVAVTSTLGGRISGDVVSTAQTAEFTGDGARNVGSGKPVLISGITLTGSDAGNYRIDGDSRSTTGTITPRPITISGLTAVTATDRVYDGTTTVQVNIPEGVPLTPGSSDIIEGDSVSIAVPEAGTTTGTMADKHVGDGKAVAITGLSLSGADAGNYVIVGTAGVTVDITPLGITSLWTGVNRIYDGSTAAQASGSSDGVLDGDAVTIRGSGVFTDGKNAGTAKPISVTGGLLSGADARNYLLLNPTGSTTADVTPRTVTVGYSSPDKVYDGTVDAPVVQSGSTGFISGDTVGTTQSAVYADEGGKNVGEDKLVQVSGITLTGADAGNYVLSSTEATTSGRITPRPLTLTGLDGIAAVDRVYDGSTSVAITVSGSGPIAVDPAGVVEGDDVSISAETEGLSTGTMADKHVGTNKPVVVDGLELQGADAGNYVVTATLGVTVNITPRPLTAVYGALDKVYDGSNTATVTGSSADLIEDDLVFIGGSGVFVAGKNVGTGLEVSISGGLLTGADAGNYLLQNTSGSAAADITPRTLVASYSGGTRIYDGTVLAPVSGFLEGLVTDDVVTLSQNAVFTGDGARNAGVGKAVSVSDIALEGADAGNYVLSGTTAVTTATVTPRPLRIIGLTGVTAEDRVYDGSREVQVTVTASGPIEANPDDLIEGDEVTLTAPGTGVTTGLMADKNVGSNKPVAVTGLEIGGADAGNYTVAETAGVTVTITPKPLTASFIGISREYDGTVDATTGGSSADIVAGDTVLIRGSGVFSGEGARNAGLNKAIDVTSALLEGADAANYSLVNTSGSATADITPRLLTTAYAGVDRVYDGSTAASVTRSITGLVEGDTVSVSESASFSDGRNVGTNKPVQIVGITLAGDDAGNYRLASSSSTTTASVTPRVLDVAGLEGLAATDRVYDGTLEVDVSVSGGGSATLAGVVDGDEVLLDVPGEGLGSGLMLDKHAGNNKPVTLSGLTLSGADAGNYLVGGIVGLTVNIAPREVTLSGVAAVDRVYDGSNLVAIDTASALIAGAIDGDLLTLLAEASGTMADKHVGVDKPVSVAGLALGGADAANYRVVDSAPISVTITPRVLSPVFSGVDRVYDGSTAAQVAITAAGVVDGDSLSLAGSAVFTGTGARNAGVDKPVSVSAVTLSGADAGNYLLAFDTGSTTATILQRLLTADATVAPRVYDGTTTAPATLVSSGVVEGDAVVLSGTATFTGPGARNAGTDKPVSVDGLLLSGSDAGNYTLGGVTSLVTTGAITPRPLTVSLTAADKVYDGDTAATVTLGDNRIEGDALTLTATGAAFETADAGSGLRVSLGGLSLAGADSINYTLPGSLPTANATIRRAALFITGGTIEKLYGEVAPLPGTAFTASGLVAGQTVGSVSLASAGAAALADVAGSPYALVPSAATGGSFRSSNYDITYVAGTLVVLPRTVTVSTDLRLAFEDELDGLSYSATVEGLLAGSGHSVVSLASPAPDLSAAVGGSLISLVHSGGTIAGTDPRNYQLRYEPGRLIVLPRPVRFDDAPDPGDSGGGFGIVFSPEEVEAARAALEEALRTLSSTPPEDGPVGPGLQPPSAPTTLTLAELGALFGSDARQITLPALQRLPLIGLDPALRRLFEAALTPLTAEPTTLDDQHAPAKPPRPARRPAANRPAASDRPALAGRSGHRGQPVRPASLAQTTAARAAAAQPTDDLRRLVESGQFELAWQRAQALPQLVGNSDFDFLYGVAAINVGRVPEGLLALERHLASAPGNDRARLELARGYFLLGEFARARSEFEFVLRYNPPGPVRARINEFLDAMQSRQAADRRSASRLYAELGAGHDSNVNQGTWRDEVEFLFGGTVNLDGTPSQAVPDSFGSLNLGGQQMLRVSNRLSVFAGLDLEQKRNVDERNYDQGSAAAYAGFTQLALGGLWRMTLSTSHLRVGGESYRNVLQLGTEATWSISPTTQLMTFVQYGEQRYAAASSSLDGSATGLGLMVTHSLADMPGQPSVGLRFGFTREDNIARLRDDLDKESPLLRVFASLSPAPRWRVAVGAVFLRQSYGDIDVVGFGTRRKDDYLAADLVVSHAIDARWSVRAEAQWSTTRSNQDLYDARRGTVALKLRYQL